MTIHTDYPTTCSTMTLAEKLNILQTAAKAPTLARFADMVGVNTVTLRRIEKRNEATDRILARIAGAFQNVTPEMLSNEEIDLPSLVQLSVGSVTARQRDEADSAYAHEGKQLLRYLERTNTKQAELAALLGVSRVQAHSYTKTERFRPEVKATILAALGVGSDVVFTGRTLLKGKLPAVSMVGLPLIRTTDRITTSDDLATLLSDFVPDQNPGRVYYVNANVLAHAPQDLLSAIAIEIGESDHMAPILRPGAIVLALKIDAAEWPDVADGSVVVLTKNKLSVRRVFRNELRTADFIEVGAYDRTQGGTLTLRQSDVQALFAITHILISPA